MSWNYGDILTPTMPPGRRLQGVLPGIARWRQSATAEFTRKHTHADIQPELAVHQGSAPDCILAFAEAQKAEVIVMGTHGRRGFDRLVLGSVTDRVMRRAPCPVLVVCHPPHESTVAEERSHVHHLSRILYCTDFSENSKRALSFAISATAEYDAELTLLHVLEGAPSAAKTQETLTAVTEQLTKLISAEASRTLRIKKTVLIGKPYQQILQLAVSTQIDMVAMGVRGRGALDAAVFGSTTYRVIQLGPCPVLAVHA